MTLTKRSNSPLLTNPLNWEPLRVSFQLFILLWPAINCFIAVQVNNATNNEKILRSTIIGKGQHVGGMTEWPQELHEGPARASFTVLKVSSALMLCKIHPITLAFIFNLFAGIMYSFFPSSVCLFDMDRKYTHLQHSKHLQRNMRKAPFRRPPGKKVKEEVFRDTEPQMDIKWVKRKHSGTRVFAFDSYLPPFLRS